MTIVTSSEEQLTFLGEVIMWAGAVSTYAGIVEPVSGWLLCNGVALSKTNPNYAALQAAIGTTYGSDPSNFFLPNLLATFAVGGPLFSNMGGAGGLDSVTLAANNTPDHTHTLSNSSVYTHNHSSAVNSSTELGTHYHGLIIRYDSLPTRPFVNTITAGNPTTGTDLQLAGPSGINSPATHTHTYTAPPADAHTHTITVSSSGSGASHNNYPAYIALHHLIRYF